MLNRHHAQRIAAVAILLGSFAGVSPVLAAGSAEETPATSTPRTVHIEKHQPSAEEMRKHVEERIKTLHAKLKITPAQETAWGEVAQAMRDSESEISSLIQERHKNAETLTAVQDLGSYQKIAQAHADGLKNVIAVFGKLYDGMSDEQKLNADKVFGGFEGHSHGMPMDHKHGDKSKL
jgi:protein CpxP